MTLVPNLINDFSKLTVNSTEELFSFPYVVGLIAAYSESNPYLAGDLISQLLAVSESSIQQKKELAKQRYDQTYRDQFKREKHPYYEVTRRLKGQQRENIESLLSSLNEACVEAAVAVVNGPVLELSRSILKDDHFPLYALKALKTGRMKQQQFATSSIFAHALKVAPNSSVLQVPLFNEKQQPTKDAKTLIEHSVRECASDGRRHGCQGSPISGYFLADNESLLSPVQIDTFFNRMQQLPAFERQFLVIKNTPSSPHDVNIVDKIMAIRSLAVFGVLRPGELSEISLCERLGVSYVRDTCVMIPSAGMMQLFLDILAPKNAVKMNFVLGVSSLHDIRENGIAATRDVGIPFGPWEPLPSEADSWAATELQYLYHDYYHSLAASCAPQKHRELFIDFLDILQSRRLIKSTHKAYGLLCNVLRDMDCDAYLPTIFRQRADKAHIGSTDNPMMFWVTLEETLQSTFKNDERGQAEIVLSLIADEYVIQENGRKSGVLRDHLLELTKIHEAITDDKRWLQFRPLFKLREIWKNWEMRLKINSKPVST
jgi:hypothetical protein